MTTVISRNIDKVSGFPDIVLIGYTLHYYILIFLYNKALRSYVYSYIFAVTGQTAEPNWLKLF